MHLGGCHATNITTERFAPDFACTCLLPDFGQHGAYSGIHDVVVSLMHAPFYENTDYLQYNNADLGLTSPLMPGERFVSQTLDTRGWFPVVLRGFGYGGGGATFANGITFSDIRPETGYGYTISLLPGDSPLVHMPEPSTWLLLLTGLSGIVLFRSKAIS